ncbi:MAG TPA: hypothetical protein VNL17_14600 [Verrucomicrobiae bacterium]|nr:hypothetical protein [Verrucomicrobiae bacterium]
MTDSTNAGRLLQSLRKHKKGGRSGGRKPLCAHCGQRYWDHRTIANHCPGDASHTYTPRPPKSAKKGTAQ